MLIIQQHGITVFCFLFFCLRKRSINQLISLVCVATEDDSNDMTCAWTSWEPWSTCSTTCGVGTMRRQRSCETSDEASDECTVDMCSGSDHEDKQCGTDVCLACKIDSGEYQVYI